MSLRRVFLAYRVSRAWGSSRLQAWRHALRSFWGPVMFVGGLSVRTDRPDKRGDRFTPDAFREHE